MNSQTQIRDQFAKSETGVGITRENFQRKFLFNGDSQSDSYLLDRVTPSPSQFQGFTIEQQKCIGYLMSEMIFKAGESLKLPVSTSIVAASIAHYFYSRVGFIDYDFRDVALGAMFLACKSQQTLRKSYEISSVFDFVFKVFEGQRMPIKVQVLNSMEYEYMRKKVIEMENEILFQEGFQVFRLFDIPHRYIGGLFKSFDRHPQSKKICQKAWIYLNDFYKTNCVLFYPGQTIAAAAVYLSLLKLNIKMPTVPWWILMQSNLESIEQLIGQLESLYDASGAHKYSLEWVAAQINEVGERHELVNVFPVNYYRKIILDTNSQLKTKKIIIQIPPEVKIEEVKEIEQKMQRNVELHDSESRERSREHKKKKKEKSKKDKKDKKKKKDRKKHYSSESKSKSKSVERNKPKRKSSSQRQYSEKAELTVRNNDETPKIVKPQPMIPQTNEAKPDSKESVKQMQVGSAKGLLSMINSQLKMREIKKQKQEAIIPEAEQNEGLQKIGEPAKQEESDNNEGSSNSDDDLMAQLIKIRKSKGKKANQ